MNDVEFEVRRMQIGTSETLGEVVMRTLEHIGRYLSESSDAGDGIVSIVAFRVAIAKFVDVERW